MKALDPGTVFAERYRIVAPLGEGGMGRVYRAEHVALCKQVALKVLRSTAMDANLEARFEREAHAIARLDHPSCVRVLDYGRAADHCQFIAMELVEGVTLGDALRSDGPFSIPRAIRVARRLLAALAHAHGQGVLHRDVKPENVILVEGAVPRVVLIDFGLAALRDAAPLTASGMCLGSPSYVAPERLLGDPIDARTDIYAVGVLLYEMIAGSRPFVGSSPEEIMSAALTRPPRPLRALRRDVSRALEALIWRALAKEPARRFADAEEMISALDDVPLLLDDVTLERAPEVQDSANTMAIEQLTVRQPSLWSRIWSRLRLRYGRWRWNHEPSGSL